MGRKIVRSSRAPTYLFDGVKVREVVDAARSGTGLRLLKDMHASRRTPRPWLRGGEPDDGISKNPRVLLRYAISLCVN